MDAPLISVCVPLFNKAATVETALRTVMAYDREPLEIVVFDNGSTDGSGDVVARLAREDSRIRHIRIEHTVMIQESWRLALLHGRGEFLKLQSADDELDPAFFQHMLPPLRERSDIGYTMCAERVDARGLESEPVKIHNMYAEINVNCRKLAAMASRAERARQLVVSSALENNLGNIYKVVVRKSCLPLERWRMVTRAYPLPTAYPDWDFLIRLMLHHRGEFVDKELSHYIITPDSPIARLPKDAAMRVADGFQRLLQVMTVLGDPALAELRSACSPQEMQMLADHAGKRVERIVNTALSIPPV